MKTRKKAIPRINLGFDQYTDAGLADKTGSIYDGMNENINFPTPQAHYAEVPGQQNCLCERAGQGFIALQKRRGSEGPGKAVVDRKFDWAG